MISVLSQRLADEEGRGFYSFTVFDTEIVYLEALYYVIVVALLAAGLLAAWVAARNETRECQECRSRVPAEATVCRFCTSELEPMPIDA